MVRAKHSVLRAAAAAAAGAVLLSGCGGKGLTAPPLQRSIAHSFANLYVLQQDEQGNPHPDAANLRPTAQCQKGISSQLQTGAGDDWVCYVTYLVAGPSTPVTATYNVDLKTDGCYAADGDGPASVNGSRTITGLHFQQVLNPLWLIDGCFDTS